MEKTAEELVLQPVTFVNKRTKHVADRRTHFTELCAEKVAARAKVSDKQRQDVFKAASAGDPDAKRELCAAVVKEVQINVLPQASLGLSFFETISYGEEDFPEIVTDLYDKNFFVTEMGLNGGLMRKQAMEAKSAYTLTFKRWASQEYEFQKYNYQTGATNYFQKASKRMTFEQAMQIDEIALAMIRANAHTDGAGQLGFPTSSAYAGATPVNGSTASLLTLLNIHPKIIQSTIPGANALDLSGIGTAGKLNPEKIKRILDYTVRYSAFQPVEGGPLSGPMRVRALHVNSTRIRDMWDQADVVSLVATAQTGEPMGSNPPTQSTQLVPEEARLQAWRSGAIEKWFGQDCPMVPSARLEANEILVAMNRPAGYFHRKPSMDEVHHNQDNELARRDAESVWMSTVGVFAMQNDTIPNFIQVKI